MSDLESDHPSKQPDPETRAGLATMFASVLCFSASNILIKIAGTDFGVSPWLLSSIRFILGIAVAGCLFKGAQKIDYRALLTDRWILARGIVGGIGVPIYNLCIMELGAAKTTIITSAYPVFGILIAIPLIGERVPPRIYAYIGLSIVGVALIAGVSGLDTGIGKYEMLAIFVAIASGFVVATIRKLHATHTTATIFASQCVYGFVLSLPFTVKTAALPSIGGAGIIVLASLLVAAGQLAMTHAFKFASVAKGSSIQLLGPIIVSILSIAVLSERITIYDCIGGALIIVSCYQIVRAKERS